MNKILLIGSGLSAKDVSLYDLNKFIVVAVNNGYLATDCWKYWVRTSDFQGQIPELKSDQTEIRYLAYSKALQPYGGEDECGLSIMLAASYWAMENLSPKEMYYLGADMNYSPDEKGNTHIYGVGYDIRTRKESDPDYMAKKYGKGDPEYLKNIYSRFYNIASKKGILVYNLSNIENTRLPYPKVDDKKRFELIK